MIALEIACFAAVLDGDAAAASRDFAVHVAGAVGHVCVIDADFAAVGLAGVVAFGFAIDVVAASVSAVAVFAVAAVADSDAAVVGFVVAAAAAFGGSMLDFGEALAVRIVAVPDPFGHTSPDLAAFAIAAIAAIVADAAACVPYQNQEPVARPVSFAAAAAAAAVVPSSGTKPPRTDQDWPRKQFVVLEQLTETAQAESLSLTPMLPSHS